MTKSPYQENFQLALEEMRLQMDRVYQSSDALDNKANFLLGGAGLVVALVAALQAQLFTGAPLKTSLLVIAVLLYAGMVLLILRALAPAKYQGPISADYKTLETFVLSESVDQAYANLLLGYTQSIDHNKTLNNAKAGAIRVCMLLFPTILIMLIIIAVI